MLRPKRKERVNKRGTSSSKYVGSKRRTRLGMLKAKRKKKKGRKAIKSWIAGGWA